MKLKIINITLAVMLIVTAGYILYQYRTIKSLIAEMEGQDKVISDQQGIIKRFRESISKETVTYSKTKGYSI